MRSAWCVAPVVLLLACGGERSYEQRAVEQCREVISFWIAPHYDMGHSVEIQNESLHVNITMMMRAALGDLPATAVCLYPAQLSDTLIPREIAIGKIRYRKPKHIAELLSLNKDFEFIDHEH